MILQIIGGLIAAVVLIQGIWLLYSSLKQQRTSTRLLAQRIDDVGSMIEAHRHLYEQEQELKKLSWSGLRKFQVYHKVEDNETSDICSLYLKPHDGRPLPTFKPGQFLTFQLHMPTSKDKPDSPLKPVIRCYSLSDRPNPEFYRITVKRLGSPNKKKFAPGMASNYLHDNIEEGDLIDIKAPGGQFFLDVEQEYPVVLIGGGVGVTPLLSMLNTLVDRGSNREVWLFYGTQNSQTQIMQEHLQQVAREYSNIHIKTFYSRPLSKDKKGQDFDFGERISLKLLKKLLPSNNYHFYICGPSEMMTTMVEGLTEWGVPENTIYYEAFGPASVRARSSRAQDSDDQAMTISFSRSGETSKWTGEATSLLELAETCGITIDAGCRVGNCNTCLTAIKNGEVTYIRDPDEMPEAGSCLPCIAIPKGDLTLDA